KKGKPLQIASRIDAYEKDSNKPGSGFQPNVQNFEITKPFDKISPTLFIAYCRGTNFKEARVIFRKAGNRGPWPYFVILFEHLYIENVDWEFSSGAAEPKETIKFSCLRFDICYTPQTRAGGAGTNKQSQIGWNLGNRSIWSK